MSLEYVIGAQDNFTKVFDKAESKLSSIGNSMTDIGKQLSLKVTTPIVGLATAAVMTTSKFDSSMSKVAAISGAVGDEFNALREQAKHLGATTVFSASEAAEGMEFLARAGFGVSDVMSAMPGMLDLAASSAIDLGAAADITSNIMSGFGIAADKAGMVADVLALATARSNTSVESMGESMKMVAPVSAGLGISMQETAAAIGILGDAGIQGGMAGTTLRAGLLRLASPTDAVKDAMAEMGVEFFDAQGNMKSLTEIVGLLETSMDGMTEQQKVSNLEMLFGKNAVSGWMAIVDAGSDSLGGFTDELFGAEGAARTMAEVMMDNLGGSFEELKSGIEGLMISFGDIMIPMIRGVVDRLTELVAWFDSLDEGQKKTMIVVGLLVAAIGPLLLALGFLATAIAAISWPVVGVVAAIGLLVGAFIYAWNNIEGFRYGVMAAFDKIKEVITNVVGIVSDYLHEKLTTIREFWAENGEQILQAVTNVFNGIKAVIDFIMPVIKWFIETTWGAIKNVINGVLNVIMGLLKIFAGLFTGDWNKLWEGVKQLFIGILEGVWGFLQLMFLGRILKLAGSFFGLFRNIFSSGLRAVSNVFSNTFNGILNFVNGLKTKFFNAGRGLINQMKDGIVNAAKAVLDAVKNIAQQIRNFLPFSPAKNGPLSDLDKLDFATPITDSIFRGLPDVQAEMSHMLDVPQVSTSPAVVGAGSSGGNRERTVNVYVEMDGRTVVRAIGQPLVDEIRVRTGVRL